MPTPIAPPKHGTKVLSLLVLLALGGGLHAEQPIELRDGWEHYRGDLGGPWEALRTKVKGDALRWEGITVPHCYNAYDAVDPDRPYYQGPAWYRRPMALGPLKPGQRVLVTFGAVGQKAEVFLNEERVATHVGGYDAFTVDLTDALRALRDEDVAPVLLVRCDNSRDVEMPPSDLSDFMLYGGIHRRVTLEVTPSVSIERVTADATLSDDRTVGRVRLTPLLRKASQPGEAVQVRVSVFAPDGQVVAERQSDGTASEPGFDLEVEQPALWSPSEPNLYRYRAEVGTGENQHAVEGRFGFRSFRFEEQGPFFLNGERLLLRGTHRHEDHAGFGAAVPDDVIREELQMIKAMGVNFIRLGHYQQSGLVLDLCDELGLLVWEEIPWCRGGLGGAAYRQTAKQMLSDMIEQHRNHPSIILWGLGNENDWPGDFAEFDKQAIRSFMSELHTLAKRLDPGRLTSIRRCDFCKDIVDVYSPSIWAGWYRGRYTDYRQVTEREMKRVGRFFHAEWGASQHAGRYSEDPDRGIEAVAGGDADERAGDFLMKGGAARVSKDGDWSESYACNLIDWHLKEQQRMPWLTGTAYWAFKDFATPLRPENPIPYVNQKGLVQRDLVPKESYYVFQSYWSEQPMVRVFGRNWVSRWGEPGEEKMVKVYSNCETVELFLNGKSLGVRRRDSQDFPAAGLRWMTPLREGENQVRAVGEVDGKQVVDEVVVRYQSTPWKQVSLLEMRLVDESPEAATVRVRAVDAAGTHCLDAKNRLRFTLAGDAELVANLGTARASRVVELANGEAEITVRKSDSDSILCVSSSGVESQFFVIGGKKSPSKRVSSRIDLRL